jgi:hypothetical protein
VVDMLASVPPEGEERHAPIYATLCIDTMTITYFNFCTWNVVDYYSFKHWKDYWDGCRSVLQNQRDIMDTMQISSGSRGLRM